MEDIGGLVFRRTRSFVETTEEDRDAAAHRAELEQLKVERTQARSDRLAKIDAKTDSLRVKLENAIERKRVKTQLRQQQREARIQALQAKANQTQGANRRRQEARIADLRREYEDKAAVR
jgi:glutamate-1-semialdehyde aminotransferase